MYRIQAVEAGRQQTPQITGHGPGVGGRAVRIEESDEHGSGDTVKFTRTNNGVDRIQCAVCSTIHVHQER